MPIPTTSYTSRYTEGLTGSSPTGSISWWPCRKRPPTSSLGAKACPPPRSGSSTTGLTSAGSAESTAGRSITYAPSSVLDTTWSSCPSAVSGPPRGMLSCSAPSRTVVKEAGGGVVLLIVGDGQERQRLEAQARQLGVDGAIRFLGFRSDVAELLALSDLVVMPSLTEASPQAAMEATAAGRPVVASRAGGLPEVVEDGVGGVLVPPASPQALSRAITELLGSPMCRAHLASGARSQATAFSLANMAHGYEAVYEAAPT